ncbi:hypothetical protein THRCLA_11226 [Thraustotheca clavata]|uniref:Uncharacterized protein n=1 Tax=Thraustotheca clavata TaxID=74557 RepID=A0A1V9Y8E2_9STRA|nr:hypothetical protein THRCLA_11226 [Thraustotheca clavata]
MEDTFGEILACPRLTKKNHRRGHSVVVGGVAEMSKIQHKQEVESLHNKLELQSKALEESLEETQLAARIGHSLLLQNQQLDMEMDAKVSALTIQCEEAENQTERIEAKYRDLNGKYKELEGLYLKTLHTYTEQQEELVHNRSRIKSTRDESSKYKDEIKALKISCERHATDLIESRQLNAEKTVENDKLLVANQVLQQQLHDLKEVNYEQSQRVIKLERQNDRSTQALAELQPQYEAIQTQYLSTKAELAHIREKYNTTRDECEAMSSQVLILQADILYINELLNFEKQTSQQLQRQNEELIDAINLTPKHSRRPSEQITFHGTNVEFNSNAECIEYKLEKEFENGTRRTEMLRQRSLFHELSIELEKEMHRAKSSSVNEIASCTTCSMLMQREASQSQKVASLTLEIQHLKEQIASLPVKEPEEEITDNILKEFFLLTAAALKIKGVGLNNDRCNISNEILYSKAMKAGVTFERFHDWILIELEGI